MVEQQQQEPDNPLMRKKKTPEELAAEAELEDQDEFTSEIYIYRIQNLIFPLKNDYLRLFNIFCSWQKT